MPAGRPIWHPWPQWLRVLHEMRDGRWYMRPVLRQMTGLRHDSLSPAIVQAFRRGLLTKRLNPYHDHADPHGPLRRVGVPAAKYVYQINERGRDALEREKTRRAKLAFRGFEPG